MYYKGRHGGMKGTSERRGGKDGFKN